MGPKFGERKAALEAAGLWIGKKRFVKFTFGNTHEMVQHPRKPLEQTNKWCMSMRINNSDFDTGKFIRSVTYTLHPTYERPVLKATIAPFLISRLAWGYFNVEMEIEF